MPADLTGDDVGAPDSPRLCPDCAQSIKSLRQKDHVDDRDSDRAAIQLARQCCQWRLR